MNLQESVDEAFLAERNEDLFTFTFKSDDSAMSNVTDFVG